MEKIEEIIYGEITTLNFLKLKERHEFIIHEVQCMPYIINKVHT